MAVCTGDDDYLALVAAWVSNGSPAILHYRGTAYQIITDNDTTCFHAIDRDDPTWRDPNDPTGRWHGAYGYRSDE